MDVMVIKNNCHQDGPTARTITSVSAQRCTGSQHSLGTIRGCCVPPIKKGGRKRAVSSQCEVRLKMATADFAIMRLTAQPHCKICIFFKRGAKNFRKPRKCTKKKRATRNRLVYRDDAEGDWASICRHRENTSRRQAKKLQPLRKPHSASV